MCVVGSKTKSDKPNRGNKMIFNEMDFMSTIITQDEYSISKIPSLKTVSTTEDKALTRELSSKGMDQFTSSEAKLEELNEKCLIPMIDKLIISETSLDPFQNDTPKNGTETEKGFNAEKAAQSNAAIQKPSLKSSGAKKVTRSVTWADDKCNSEGNGNLCEFSELEEKKEASEVFGFTNMEEDGSSFRFASAEACAIALSQAAEAVASGESDAPDAGMHMFRCLRACLIAVDIQISFFPLLLLLFFIIILVSLRINFRGRTCLSIIYPSSLESQNHIFLQFLFYMSIFM